MPAWSMRRMVSGLEEAGPIVATIFVRDIVQLIKEFKLACYLDINCAPYF
jgi:hypothetical protein